MSASQVAQDPSNAYIFIGSTIAPGGSHTVTVWVRRLPSKQSRQGHGLYKLLLFVNLLVMAFLAMLQVPAVKVRGTEVQYLNVLIRR